MSDQLSLDDIFGHVGPREATIRDAFWRFHTDNPHVYDELVRLAQTSNRAGHRTSIAQLFEVLRWQHGIGTRGDDFKLNNSYRSYYARLIMRREPDLDGIFNLRALHGPDLQVAA